MVRAVSAVRYQCRSLPVPFVTVACVSSCPVATPSTKNRLADLIVCQIKHQPGAPRGRNTRRNPRKNRQANRALSPQNQRKQQRPEHNIVRIHAGVEKACERIRQENRREHLRYQHRTQHPARTETEQNPAGTHPQVLAVRPAAPQKISYAETPPTRACVPLHTRRIQGTMKAWLK